MDLLAGLSEISGMAKEADRRDSLPASEMISIAFLQGGIVNVGAPLRSARISSRHTRRFQLLPSGGPHWTPGYAERR